MPSTRLMRGRVVLALELAVLAGLALPWLLRPIMVWSRELAASICAPLGSNGACRLSSLMPQLRSPVLAAPAAVIASVVLLVLVAVAARWCLAPIRRVVEPLAAVGPQNLGYRVSQVQPGLLADPELAMLARTVDTMMDRVSAGYESQRRFAANASHELRTPLSVQRTLIEVGLVQEVTPQQLQLLTRQLLATNERNERLIEGLLVLAETDQGLESQTRQRLDEIAAAVVSVHAHTAQAAGVDLVAEVTPVAVAGERVLLERLVTNLVQNGIKYNRPGGRVVVRVFSELESRVCVLAVWNTGDPVAGESVAGLFEPFRRLRGERIDHSGGAGLGLTIARSIVAAHDGTIGATANEDGEGGLTVRVRLAPAGASGGRPRAQLDR